MSTVFSRRGLAFFAALALAWSAQSVLAHPHGTVQCGFAVDYKDGKAHRLTGRLLFDQAHSEQALQVLRDPVSQKLDDALQKRFVFGLRQQLARWSWLFAVSVDGQTVELTEASTPALWWSSDGRLGVMVDLAITSRITTALTTPIPAAIATDRPALPTATSSPPWTFSCSDPTRYWVSDFLSVEAEIEVFGCAAPVRSPALKTSTGPQAGGISIQVRCAD